MRGKNYVLDLSDLNQRAVSNWSRTHRIDKKLLVECSYYPRGGCQHCSWDRPNPTCNRSHILIDTRIDGGPIYTPTSSPSQKKNNRKTAWGVSIEEMLKRFPKGIQENILKIMAE